MKDKTEKKKNKHTLKGFIGMLLLILVGLLVEKAPTLIANAQTPDNLSVNGCVYNYVDTPDIKVGDTTVLGIDDGNEGYDFLYDDIVNIHGKSYYKFDKYAYIDVNSNETYVLDGYGYKEPYDCLEE